MLTVYGLNGRIFSGSLEGLRELGPVQAVARLRAVEPVRRDALEEPSVLLGGPVPGEPGGLLATPEPRQQAALAAYSQTQAQRGAGGAARQALNLTEQLMSRQLITVPVSSTVAQGLDILARARIGQAPVLNRQQRLVGLLLRADLLPIPSALQDGAAWARWFERPVGDVMWTPVPAARPDTPLREVAQALLDLRLPGLPVMNDAGELLGFISRSDILRAVTREPPLDLWG
jgi:CBS domain-containing protein